MNLRNTMLAEERLSGRLAQTFTTENTEFAEIFTEFLCPLRGEKTGSPFF
jgi:hypothetical protein